MWVITQLVALNLAWMVTLAVPMAVLVSTLMAFGGMSSTNELTIMRASGISLFRLMIPVLIAAAGVTYLMVLFNNDVLPEANHSARVLFTDITRAKPTFILEPGKFSDDIGGTKILVQKTFTNSNRLEGIYIYDYSNENFRNLITAASGDISFTNDFKKIVMNLDSGEIHQLNNRDFADKYRIVKFGHHRITMDAEGFGFQRSSENALQRGDRELSSKAMNQIIDSLKAGTINTKTQNIQTINTELKKLTHIKYTDTVFRALEKGSLYDTLKNTINNIRSRLDAAASYKQLEEQVEKQADSYEVEIYKKYSIPFACLVFAMVGAPLGYKVRKGGFGIAAGLSLAFFLFYWASLIGGEKLADRGMLSPFMGMWAANILLGIFGLYLMFKSS
jgi:lipopolysaccharide export system permease protein